MHTCNACKIICRLTFTLQVLSDQPHKHLFNFARVLRCSKACVQLAVCVLNDLLIYTDTAAQHPAAALAAAALAYSIEQLSQRVSILLAKYN